MSSYQVESKQETQQCVPGLLNCEGLGLPTVLDQYLKVSERICQIEASQKDLTEEVKSLKQQKECLKEQIDECLKKATDQEELKESIAQVLGRLEAHEKNATALNAQNRIYNLEKTVAEQGELIKKLFKLNSELQIQINEPSTAMSDPPIIDSGIESSATIKSTKSKPKDKPKTQTLFFPRY